MTSRALSTTWDPSRTAALKENTWAKIKSCTEDMQRDGFEDGDVVWIRKVRERIDPPAAWMNVVCDTQYLIGRKVLVKSVIKHTSSFEPANMVPHNKLRLGKTDKNPPPTMLENKDMVWLAEAHSWPDSESRGEIKTIPQRTRVEISNGPYSKKGGDTSHITNPTFWNYVVIYPGGYNKSIHIQKHIFWVDAANFHPTAEREPANPTT